MPNYFDKYDTEPQSKSNYFDQYDEQPKRTIATTAQDVGASLGMGVLGAKDALIGLANIPTLGQAGRAADLIGLNEVYGDPQQAEAALVDNQRDMAAGKRNEFLDKSLYSAAQQHAQRKVTEADGVWGKLKAAVQNPSVIATSVGESLPSMVAGGFAGAGLRAGATSIAPKIAARFAPETIGVLAGAAGEGLVGAGSAAEQTRKQSVTGTLTPAQSGMAATSGLGTSVFGYVGGKIANKLGFADADTMLATGQLSNAIKAGGWKEVAKRIIGGGISEGAFEELPQSVQEQMWQNAATDKPLMEGVDEAAVMGALSGFSMGAGANMLPQQNRSPVVQPPPTGNASSPSQGQSSQTAPLDKKVPDNSIQDPIIQDIERAFGGTLDPTIEDRVKAAQAYNQQQGGVASGQVQGIETNNGPTDIAGMAGQVDTQLDAPPTVDAPTASISVGQGRVVPGAESQTGSVDAGGLEQTERKAGPGSVPAAAQPLVEQARQYISTTGEYSLGALMKALEVDDIDQVDAIREAAFAGGWRPTSQETAPPRDNAVEEGPAAPVVTEPAPSAEIAPTAEKSSPVQPDPKLVESQLSDIAAADQDTLNQMAEHLPGFVESNPQYEPHRKQFSDAISVRQRELIAERKAVRDAAKKKAAPSAAPVSNAVASPEQRITIGEIPETGKGFAEDTRVYLSSVIPEKLKLYRSVWVDNDGDVDVDNPGLFWAETPEGARRSGFPPEGKSRKQVLLEIDASRGDIDVETSISRRRQYGEPEIVLKGSIPKARIYRENSTPLVSTTAAGEETPPASTATRTASTQSAPSRVTGEGATPPVKQPWEMTRWEHQEEGQRRQHEREQSATEAKMADYQKAKSGDRETLDRIWNELVNSKSKTGAYEGVDEKTGKPEFVLRRGSRQWAYENRDDLVKDEAHRRATDKPGYRIYDQDGAEHRRQVARAIKEGKQVPESVLAEYPNLAPKQSAREQIAAKKAGQTLSQKVTNAVAEDKADGFDPLGLLTGKVAPPPKTEAEREPNEAAIKTLDARIEREEANLEDWKGRKYKPNSKTVSVEGDRDSLNAGDTSIGAANARRRQRAIQSSEKALQMMRDARKELDKATEDSEVEAILNGLIDEGIVMDSPEQVKETPATLTKADAQVKETSTKEASNGEEKETALLSKAKTTITGEDGRAYILEDLASAVYKAGMSISKFIDGIKAKVGSAWQSVKDKVYALYNSLNNHLEKFTTGSERGAIGDLSPAEKNGILKGTKKELKGAGHEYIQQGHEDSVLGVARLHGRGDAATEEAARQVIALETDKFREKQSIVTIKQAQDWLEENGFPRIAAKSETAGLVDQLLQNKAFQDLSIFDKIRVAAQLERPIRNRDYSPKVAPASNKKLLGQQGIHDGSNQKVEGSGIVAADTSAGCDHYCFECYALKGSAQASVSHQHPVLVQLNGTLKTGEVLRIGEKGDPSKNWAHAHEQVSALLERSQKRGQKVDADDVFFITKLLNLDGFNPETARNLQVTLDPMYPEHMWMSMRNILRLKAAYPQVNISTRIRSFVSKNADLNGSLRAAVEFSNRYGIPILETRMRFLRKSSFDLLELDHDAYKRDGNQYKPKKPILNGEADIFKLCDEGSSGCPGCKNCIKLTKGRDEYLPIQNGKIDARGISGLPLPMTREFDPVGGNVKYSESSAVPPSQRADLESELAPLGKLRLRRLMNGPLGILDTQEDALRLVGDILTELYEKKVDAVKIGDWDSDNSEQELVIINPQAIVKFSGEHFSVYQKKRQSNPTIDDITKIFDAVKASEGQKLGKGDFIKVKYSADGKTIAGLYLNGRAYLVRDGIARGETVGILLHELSEHAFHLGFTSDAEYQAILNTLDARQNEQGATGKAIRAAMAAVPTDTPAEHRLSETMAYLLQQNANSKLGIVQRIASFFRRWLVKTGFVSPDILKTEDFVGFAKSAIRAASGVGAREQAMFSLREKFGAVDTESAAFRKWFAGSQVVDEDGKPMQVYHGTTSDVADFVPNFRKGEILGFGIHFTSDPEFASRYASDPDVARKGKTPNVVPVYLQMQNPLRADSIAMEGSPEYALAKQLAGARFYPQKNEAGVRAVWVQGAIDATSGKRAERLIRAAGYDGVLYTTKLSTLPDASGRYQVTGKAPGYIVFSPTQIKSALSNIGEFSPSDPRLQYSVRNGQADERNPPPIEGTTKEDPYQQVVKQERSRYLKLRRSTIATLKGIAGGVDKYLGSISTRLKNISPKLEGKIRELDYNIGTKSTADIKSVEPLLAVAKQKMTRDDFITWDYARKNSDVAKIEGLVKKYGMQAEYAKYRATLNRIYNEAKDVGIDLGWIDEYAPRVLKDAAGFLEETGRGDQWPVISQKLKEVAARMEMTVADMSPELKADIVAGMLFSGHYGMGKPGNAKERVISMVPPKYNQFYMDSDAALMHYLHNMRKHIEARRFFGKVPDIIAEAKRNMNKAMAQLAEERNKEIPNSSRIENLTDAIDAYRSKLEKYKNQRDYSQNIGQYVIELMEAKEIRGDQQQELINILKARFNERGTHGVVQLYKNFSYLDTMGSFTSAITQIGDLPWTIYANGWNNTLKAVSKAIIGKSRITKEDVGIERIAQEFADSDTLSKAVAKVFKFTGLEKMDTIGKEAFLNAAFDKYVAMAKKSPGVLRKDLTPIFGKDASLVVADFADGKVTDGTKLFVYSKLLDFQPAAMSEMTEMYLGAGNGRLFYMLKTYTLKQFDVFRREGYNVIKTGDKGSKIKALRNMTYLAMLLVLANGGADEIKDFLLGRKTDFSDRVVDNILRLFGVSKYLTWKARTEGYGTAVVKQILPPFKFIDSLSKDISSAGNGKGLDTVQSIPLVGKLAYWHLGKGKNAHRDLVEIRFSREKKRLEDIKDRVEENPELAPKYRQELSKLKRYRSMQYKVNTLKTEYNKVKLQGKKTGKDVSARLEAVEEKRLGEIKRFLGAQQ